jgi:hypothetical protein
MTPDELQRLVGDYCIMRDILLQCHRSEVPLPPTVAHAILAATWSESQVREMVPE